MMSVCTQQQPEETLKRLHIYIGKIINGHRIGNQHLLCAKRFQCFQNSLCSFIVHGYNPPQQLRSVSVFPILPHLSGSCKVNPWVIPVLRNSGKPEDVAGMITQDR